ncbi:MAG TPA: hypothetical protein VHA34_01105 [Actinomycetes bacterium]|nr:hypothetical protein [Actinomycetes bacterium]
MSESKRSFWSTIPGLVTGLAGLLTGVVGLVTVLIQLGVLGGDDSNQSVGTAETTVPGGAPTSRPGGTTATTEAPSFTVTPGSLDFKPADPREKTVTLRNTSELATITFAQPQVTGQDRGQFSASSGTCSGPVRPNLSCEMRVTFSPSGPLRTYTALLQITAPGAARGEEVRLTATTIL